MTDRVLAPELRPHPVATQATPERTLGVMSSRSDVITVEPMVRGRPSMKSCYPPALGEAMGKILAVVVTALAPVLLALPTSVPAQVAAVSGVEVVRAFSPARDKPLTRTRVTADQGGWRIDPASAGPVRLFEVAGSTCEACRLIYRAKVKTRNLLVPAFLEMWVRVPGKGQFFSRGLDQTVSGSADWVSIEIPFFLEKGQRADLVKLNVSFQGEGGSLWVREVQLLKAPWP